MSNSYTNSFSVGPDKGAVKIVLLQHLENTPRRRITREIAGRTITVVYHRGRVFALDSACYHLGGPLGEEGDIEDSAEGICIVCPWHHRKIDLTSGQQVDSTLSGHICTSKDVKQRIYPTAIDVDGWIWVDIFSSSPAAVPSDKYNCASRPGVFGPGFGLGSKDTASVAPPELDWKCEAPPLTPFAGIYKEARPPSPVKGSQRAEVKTLPFRAHKASTRNSAARMAVLASLRAPPLFQDVASGVQRGPVQTTLTDHFSSKSTRDMLETS